MPNGIMKTQFSGLFFDRETPYKAGRQHWSFLIDDLEPIVVSKVRPVKAAAARIEYIIPGYRLYRLYTKSRGCHKLDPTASGQ
jgi:hypothetical protein